MIVLGSDHAGYPLKEFIKARLQAAGLSLLDIGTGSAEDVDYPLYGRKAAEMVADGTCDRGIVFCGTGVGISMAANRIRGARCVTCTESCSAVLARRHNNANMLALGARVIGEEQALCIVNAWLNTPYDGGERHDRRVGLLDSQGS